MGNRAGDYRTNLSGEAAYKSFIPNPLPPCPSVEMDDEMIFLLVKANKELAALESISSRIPNMNLFVSMYVRKEALDISFNTASSAIKRLIDAGILVQTENASRNRTFAYEKYLGILKRGT